MKAAVLVGPKKIEIADIPNPVPDDGEVLIRIRQAGICGTDYSLFSGHLPVHYPIIPGHEGVGEIAALGSNVKRFSVGDRVTLQPNFACGRCDTCRKGRQNLCLKKIRLGMDIDGAFAEYVRVPKEYVWKLPGELPYSIGVLTEPLAVALHVLKKSSPKAEEKVLIYGSGVIGLLLLQLAMLSEGAVTAFDVAEPRLNLARELGAERTCGSISDLERDAGAYSLIYETSGTAEALARSVTLCAPGGRIVMVGIPSQEFPVSSVQIVRKELVILGSMIYTDEFPSALGLLHQGKIKARPLISNVYELENLSRALEEYRSPHRVKMVILAP